MSCGGIGEAWLQPQHSRGCGRRIMQESKDSMGYLVRPCPKGQAQPGLNASACLASRETSHTLLNSNSESFREVGEEARSRRQDGRKALERVRSFGQVTKSLSLQFFLQCEGLTTAAVSQP